MQIKNCDKRWQVTFLWIFFIELWTSPSHINHSSASLQRPLSKGCSEISENLKVFVEEGLVDHH